MAEGVAHPHLAEAKTLLAEADHLQEEVVHHVAEAAVQEADKAVC